jgi:hypothetical protein
MAIVIVAQQKETISRRDAKKLPRKTPINSAFPAVPDPPPCSVAATD